MEIDFNPSRVPPTEPSQPVARRDDAAAAQGTSFQLASALQDQLNSQPAVRPEKVAQAQALVSHEKYPPDDVLDRIAVLLAINVRQ
jgi:hypothetical protein